MREKWGSSSPTSLALRVEAPEAVVTQCGVPGPHHCRAWPLPGRRRGLGPLASLAGWPHLQRSLSRESGGRLATGHPVSPHPFAPCPQQWTSQALSVGALPLGLEFLPPLSFLRDVCVCVCVCVRARTRAPVLGTGPQDLKLMTELHAPSLSPLPCPVPSTPSCPLDLVMPTEGQAHGWPGGLGLRGPRKSTDKPSPLNSSPSFLAPSLVASECWWPATHQNHWSEDWITGRGIQGTPGSIVTR